ncbi:MAG: SDR family oxidoreductase [Lacisediminihabitans sp.]
MNILKGQVVVVSGASRGLGEAMAVAFASEGATVVLAARTESDLNRVAERCRKAGATDVLTVPTDVTQESDVDALAQTTLDHFGALDVFVADAGVSPMSVSGTQPGTLLSYDFDVVQHMFAVNAVGMWLCMKAALSRMSPGGSFIAIGSGTPGSTRGGMLSVTKSCVDMFVAIASKEMAEKNIRVNVLAPGGMADTHLFGPKGMPEYLKGLPAFVEVDVIVPAAVWLASRDSADVTGAQLTGVEFNSIGAEGVRSRLAA